jgi:hypothetical protein
MWKYGWPGGLFMFAVIEVLPMIKNQKFDPFSCAIGILIWSLGALWIGYIVQRVKSKKS